MRRARSFHSILAERNPNPERRRWLFVPYDQLTDAIGPLSREDPAELGIVLVENPAKGNRRPYHRQKLALILANTRHFALEQAERGVAVRHVVAAGATYASALEPIAKEVGPIRVMEPAERELRVDLAPLIERGLLNVLPHEGWLTTRDQFHRATKGGTPPFRMETFYRLVRRESGILMQNGKPVGGKYNFDAENRKAWRGTPAAAVPPIFPAHPITEEVGALIEERFAHHPGRLDLDHLPATARDAETLWQWARRDCLPMFGPFEDAMSTKSRTLFHTRLSPLVNISRLLPARLIREVQQLDIPLSSKEGFIRQLLGWREFVRHVHVETDGFRRSMGPSFPAGVTGRTIGTGGYSRWSGHDWPTSEEGPFDGGAAPDFLGARRPLPNAYWGTSSGLACLDCVVADVWDEGYSHHITRLMILSNIATLLDVSPRELTDWFWAAYVDAFDWVVEPNVLGMGSFAVGSLLTTKPYIAGAAYIDKMSDYCGACAFDPRSTCPITRLYWAFLDRHEPSLRGNPRLLMPLNSLRRRAADVRERDRKVYEITRDLLDRGETLTPADFSKKGPS